MKTLGTILRTGLGTATVGVLAVMAMTSSLGAQEQDEGWWEAEELLTGAEFKEAPDGRVIALDAYGPRDRQRNRQRGNDRYRDYDGDDYDDDYRGDRYDRRDDRYDDRDRYRGRNGGIVIPGGRVRVRPRARRGYALDRYAYRPLWRHADWRVRFRRTDHYDRYDYRRPSLRDIVGRGTVRRLQRHRDRIGAHGPLRYRWVSLGRRGEVLQVRAGRTAIAELVDFHFDGRVDVVRLARY